MKELICNEVEEITEVECCETVKKKKRARVATEIIVAAIGAVALVLTAIFGYSATTYKARHGKTYSSGKTGAITFQKASGSKSATFDIKPAKGTLYVSVRQSQGTKNTKYKIYYKKNSSKKYGSAKTTVKLSSNNKFSKEKKLGSVSKGKTYNCRVTKTNNTGKQSKIEVDWLLK